MPDTLPITRPVLGEPECSAAARAILSGWVTQGPETAAFEQEFADFTGAPYACAVSSCTAALHMALLASGIGRGDEVITVSHSFIATANAIRYCGATPVFVDIDPRTWNLDPALLVSAYSRRTRAVVCVHQMGLPCDLAAITAFTRAHGLILIEDAACAAGSEVLWNGRFERIGRPHGDIACFSFHPRKLITTGEGGMLTTQHRELDQRFRLLRQHGMSVSDTTRHTSSRALAESYDVEGYNYRLSDIQAAVGREQLKRLPHLVSRRRELADRYREVLSGIAGLNLPEEPSWARTNWQSFCIRLPEWADQRTVMQKMLDRGIATRRGIMCAHREPAWSDPGSWRMPIARSLVRSEAAQDQCIILPLFDSMTSDDQQRVGEALAAALAESAVAADSV